jgi:hypothetical protein
VIDTRLRSSFVRKLAKARASNGDNHNFRGPLQTGGEGILTCRKSWQTYFSYCRESPKSRDAMHKKMGLLDAEAVFFLVRGAFT